VWRSRRLRRVAGQLVFVAVVVTAVYVLWFNLVTNMRAFGQRLDFSYLGESAGFRIGGTSFRSSQTILDGLLVGVKNTVTISLLGIALALVLGVMIGISRLSTNWLVARAAAVYVQAIRNIPLLAIIFFWYAAVILKLPRITDAATFGPFLVSNRGVVISESFTLRPEFLALLAALVMYTASHIAEIVRGSIQAVPRGATEAATALGLSPTKRLQLVVLPLATRIALPQVVNQFLNLLKNSSLGIAVAYAELMAVSQVSIANGAPAPQTLAIVMAFYLAISLLISGSVNLYDRRFVSGRLR